MSHPSTIPEEHRRGRQRPHAWITLTFTLLVLCGFAVPSLATITTEFQINASPAQPGEQVLVEIFVANDGTGPESGLQVQVPYPPGLSVLGEGLIAGEFNAGLSCAAVGSSLDCSAGDTLFFDLSTLGPGAVRVLSFPVTVLASQTDGSQIDWTLDVVNDDGLVTSNGATLPIDDNAVAAISIEQDRSPVQPGALLSYTIPYGNPSPGSLVAPTLTFTIPDESTIVAVSGGGMIDDGVVSWNLADLPAGFVGQETVQVQVDGDAAAGTLLASSATLDASANFEATSREARRVAVVGNDGPLALAVNINPRPAQPGEQALVSFNLANTSASPVFDAEVFVRFPQRLNTLGEGLILANFDAGGSCAQVGSSLDCSANDFLFWRFDVLNPGQSIELSLPVTVTSGAPSGALIDWTVEVTEANGSLAVETTTLAVDTNAVATVAIDEDKDPVAAGDVLTYTVHYGNPSPTTLIATQLTLQLAPGTTFLSASGGGIAQGDEVNWSFGDLAAGFVGRQTVRVQVDGALPPGTLLPVGAELAGTSNFQPAIERAQQTAYVQNAGPLALTLNVNPAPAAPGEQVLVSLDVANTSMSPVFDAEVLIRFPQGINTVGEQLIVGGFDASGSCAQVGSSLDCSTNDFLFWRFDVLNPGQSIELSLPATVSASRPSGSLSRWAARVTEANGSRAWESNTLAADSAAVAALAIDEDRDPVISGERLTYTIHYGNPSTTSIGAAQLRVVLPPNTSFISASGGAMVAGDEVSWNLGDLTAGLADRETLTVAVDAGLPGGTLIPVNGELTGTFNFQPTVRRVQETAYVANTGRLALTLNVNPRPARPGEQVLVSLNVANTSPSPVLDAQVLVRFPQRINTVSERLFLGAFDAGASCSGVGSSLDCSANDLLIWRFATLNPGQSFDLSFPVTVASGTPSGALSDWTAELVEANGSRIRRSRTLTIDSNALAALAIDEDKDPVAPGDVVNYVVSYGNPAVSGIEDVSLTFTIPEDALFLGASDGGTFDGTTVTWSLGDLPVGAIGRCVVQLRVRAVTPAGTLLPTTAALEGMSNFREANRRVSETAYVADDSPLSLRLTATPLPGSPGGQEEITLLLENVSGDTVLDAQVVLRYALGMNTLSESNVTGGLDAGASCAEVGSSLDCSANDFLIWNFPSLGAGEQRELTLPPVVSVSTALGQVLEWRTRVTEASGSEAWESVPLPIGSAADGDGDGVADSFDNCITVSNADQRDSNGDGFGNLCDGDFNGDLLTNGIDFRSFRQVIQSTDNPDQDLNGDGIVNGPDFVILRGLLGRAPGPSGLVP